MRDEVPNRSVWRTHTPTHPRRENKSSEPAKRKKKTRTEPAAVALISSRTPVLQPY